MAAGKKYGVASALGGFSKALADIAKMQMMHGQAKEMIDYKAQAEERLLYARHQNDIEMDRIKNAYDKTRTEFLAAETRWNTEKTIESKERMDALKMKLTATEGEANRAVEMFATNARLVVGLGELDIKEAQQKLDEESLDVQKWSAEMGFKLKQQDFTFKSRAVLAEGDREWLESIMGALGAAEGDKSIFFTRDLPILIEARRALFGQSGGPDRLEDFVADITGEPYDKLLKVSKGMSPALIPDEEEPKKGKSFISRYDQREDWKRIGRFLFPNREGPPWRQQGEAMLRSPDWSGRGGAAAGPGFVNPYTRVLGPTPSISQPEFPKTRTLPNLEEVFSQRKAFEAPSIERAPIPNEERNRIRLRALEAISREPGNEKVLEEFDKTIEEILNRKKAI